MRKAHVLLAERCQRGIKLWVAIVNPCQGIELPAVDSHEMVILDDEEGSGVSWFCESQRRRRSPVRRYPALSTCAPPDRPLR